MAKKTETVVPLYSVIRNKFPKGEYALLKEVSDAPGFARSRSLDYMAISLWPSRGLHIHGIEVKSHRSDWLRELKNPKKQESVFVLCDYFWLVTDSEDVTNLEEIPETWGWMARKGKRMFIKKPAPKLDPIPISREFLAVLLKRADNKDGYISMEEVSPHVQSAIDRTEERAELKYSKELQKAQQLKETVTQFEKETGIRLDRRFTYESLPKETGKQIEFLRDGDTKAMETALSRILNEVTQMQSRIKEALEVFKENDIEG